MALLQKWPRDHRNLECDLGLKLRHLVSREFPQGELNLMKAGRESPRSEEHLSAWERLASNRQGGRIGPFDWGLLIVFSKT